MVETSNTWYKILILSGVLLALEVSEWPPLSPPFYEEGQTQERNWIAQGTQPANGRIGTRIQIFTLNRKWEDRFTVVSEEMPTRGLKLAVDFLSPLCGLSPGPWILLCAFNLPCQYTKSNSHFYRKILCLNSAFGYRKKWQRREATESSWLG